MVQEFERGLRIVVARRAPRNRRPGRATEGEQGIRLMRPDLQCNIMYGDAGMQHSDDGSCFFKLKSQIRWGHGVENRLTTAKA